MRICHPHEKLGRLIKFVCNTEFALLSDAIVAYL